MYIHNLSNHITNLEIDFMASVKLGDKPNWIFCTSTFSKDLQASRCSIANASGCLPNFGRINGLFIREREKEKKGENIV